MELFELLPILMFATLAILLFSGYPVAFVLGGIGLFYGFVGIIVSQSPGVEFPLFNFNQFFSLISRTWGGVAENLILVAVPMFVFMGTMLERSGVASDLLHTLQILLRRVSGGLALAVTLMGTIFAATTGIIGASVVMMTLMALPIMLERGYYKPLATGTIAASGTLGILIPPSIMLVIMADLMSISVGTLFMAAIFPGLLLAGLYLVYIYVRTRINPELAPPLPDEIGPESRRELWVLIIRSFLPPIFLIALVLGSIFAGFATPTEAAGVGALGATILAIFNRKLTFSVLKDVVERTALTNAMIFGIVVGATCFSYVYRSLGGDDLVHEFVAGMGLGPWGVLFLMMGIVFALGFFFDWIEITLIVLPLFTPIMKTLDFGGHIQIAGDILPWMAILLAVNLQTSFLTPPFGFALFYMKGVAPPEVRIQEIYRGIIPFVLLQLLGLAIVIEWPAIALWLPHVALD
ncbi:MAG: C4-dicarboxylate ABC transporter [Rhodospirillaceae bacterium]|nr:C4-dicarboxylate ABC transporter [Rhodospirillaceae bacterium]